MLTAYLNFVSIPPLCPLQCVLIDSGQKEVVEKPYMSSIGDAQAVVDLQIDKEVVPFLADALGDVVPYTLDPCVVYRSTPDIQTATEPSVLLHPRCYFEVFSAMISTHSTGHPVD